MTKAQDDARLVAAHIIGLLRGRRVRAEDLPGLFLAIQLIAKAYRLDVSDPDVVKIEGE